MTTAEAFEAGQLKLIAAANADSEEEEERPNRAKPAKAVLAPPPPASVTNLDRFSVHGGLMSCPLQFNFPARGAEISAPLRWHGGTSSRMKLFQI